MPDLLNSYSKNHGKSCLVTGATGLVGNNVVRRFLDTGWKVKVLVRPRHSGPTVELEGLPVEKITGTLEDISSLRRAVDGIDLVIHSAAMVHCGWGYHDEMYRVNVDGTANLAEITRLAGARFIHVSSVDALGLRSDGIPADEETSPGGMVECPYVLTKRMAESAVLTEVERGLDAVIVNPVYMIGPWDWKPSSGRMLLEVASGKGLLAPPGANDFVDVRDAVSGIEAANERGQTGRRYILGGHAMTYLDAWKVFAKVAGRRPPIGNAPPLAVRVAGRLGDLAGTLLRREPPVNSAAAEMSMLRHNFSCQRAIDELDYKIRPLEVAAADAWAWFCENGYAKNSGERYTQPASCHTSYSSKTRNISPSASGTT
ncbi:MAG: NAD-dependent epimerase/dehydratase family protein [Planctomycetaceae bacterium]|jgi:dihydroflavonol-4-reductase|nr:NAD-dependent epimerase/dehydratase family protein [Planctomycetaceae bacterium]